MCVVGPLCMCRLSVASREQIEQIYGESHRLWGAGLSRADYSALWAELSRTAWATKHARFYVWLDGRDQILSSMKVYTPRLRLCGATSRLTVLGAIFTPVARRNQGYATAMVRHVLQDAGRAGSRIALLFSDIGTAYYSGLGFRSLPAEEQSAPLRRVSVVAGAGWSFEPAQDGEMNQIRRAHEDCSASRSIAVVRDEEHWEFLQVRSSRFFARLRDSRVRQVCRVARFRGEFVAYLISAEGHGEWNVREVGALGGDPSRIADVLRLGAGSARLSGLTRLHGWLPPEIVPVLEDWPMEVRSRERAIPMVLPLEEKLDLSTLSSPRETYIPFQDQF